MITDERLFVEGYIKDFCVKDVVALAELYEKGDAPIAIAKIYFKDISTEILKEASTLNPRDFTRFYNKYRKLLEESSVYEHAQRAAQKELEKQRRQNSEVRL